MYAIEKDIPLPAIPEYRSRAGRPLKFDWGQLQPGDSVLMPSRNEARSALNFGATRGLRFATAKQVERPYGWRVWRVA